MGKWKELSGEEEHEVLKNLGNNTVDILPLSNKKYYGIEQKPTIIMINENQFIRWLGFTDTFESYVEVIDFNSCPTSLYGECLR